MHSVPKWYLDAFAAPEEPGLVWQFDKKTLTFTESAISTAKILQQREFYDLDAERELYEKVEKPGNSVINKLRSHKAISGEDRAVLARYIATMLTRVNRHRTRKHELYPQVLTEVLSNFRADVRSAAFDKIIDQSIIERWLTEADLFEKKYQENPPPDIHGKIRNPFPSNQLINLVFSMRWRFLQADGPSYFITSDNPVFFFECWGLGSPESEFTFPLSHDLAICGYRSTVQRSEEWVKSQKLVREVNRRTAHAASRFVFYRKRVWWVAKIASKSNPELQRIYW